MKFQVTKRRLLPGLMVLILFTSLSSVLSQSTAASDYPADVAYAWFDLQLDLVRDTPGFSPPVASRAFGYTGVALYEALVGGMPAHQSLAGQLNGLTDVPPPASDVKFHWGIVANSALAEITRLLFPTASEDYQAAINALYDEWAARYQSETDTEVFDRSVMHGQAVAKAVFDWSMSDGGHEGYLHNFPSDFAPPVGAGLWVPTPRTNGDPQPAMQPYWGDNRPFVLQSGAECMPAAPPEHSEEPGTAFYLEAMEVYEASQMLTDEQRDIALFWADDPGQTATPPGHSISILTQILHQEGVSLDFAAQAYAKMGIAVADAFIGCWHAKYTYNLVRPVTYIQQLVDPDWMPVVNTPPFPEYPSGHSVQTGAAAVVLADLFGEEYTFTDHTHDERGLTPRTFTSFSEMAEETAISRLYGGIHYRAAIALGLEQGKCIGEQVNELHFLREG